MLHLYLVKNMKHRWSRCRFGLYMAFMLIPSAAASMLCTRYSDSRDTAAVMIVNQNMQLLKSSNFSSSSSSSCNGCYASGLRCTQCGPWCWQHVNMYSNTLNTITNDWLLNLNWGGNIVHELYINASQTAISTNI